MSNPEIFSPHNASSMPGQFVDSSILLYDDVNELAKKLADTNFNIPINLNHKETEILRNLIDFFNVQTQQREQNAAITWKPLGARA